MLHPFIIDDIKRREAEHRQEREQNENVLYLPLGELPERPVEKVEGPRPEDSDGGNAMPKGNRTDSHR